ncbi:MAG: hypothetical protein V3U22_03245, partial [Vicinamibacteria bacterium]
LSGPPNRDPRYRYWHIVEDRLVARVPLSGNGRRRCTEKLAGVIITPPVQGTPEIDGLMESPAAPRTIRVLGVQS